MYIYMYMAKNVALSDVAYSYLERIKHPGESFSDVVMRIANKGKQKGSLRRFAGVWRDDPEIKEIFDKILKERHEKPSRSVKF